MNDLEKNIDATIEKLSLKILKIEEEKKSEILSLIYENFVEGNPRALWLSFKQKAKSIDFKTKYPYLYLSNLFDDNENLYILFDDFNRAFHLYQGKINHILELIGESEGIDEYYVLNEFLTKIVCENDHGELLFVELNKTNVFKSNSPS